LTFKSFKNYLNGIRQCLNLLGVKVASFNSMPLLERACRGYKKASKMPGTKLRLPVTTSILARIHPRLSLLSSEDRTFWAMATVGVLGLFRLGELTPMSSDKERYPRIRNLKAFSNDHVGLVLEVSKADPFRMSVTVHLTKTDHTVCAITALTSMLALRRNMDKDEPLFRLPGGKPATRDWFIAKLRKFLQLIGEDESAYNGHSLRKGGAQSLYDAGVSDSDIRVLGRWHSWAFRLYFRLTLESIQSRLASMARSKPSKLILDYSGF
jgi:hypothetical protein